MPISSWKTVQKIFDASDVFPLGWPSASMRCYLSSLTDSSTSSKLFLVICWQTSVIRAADFSQRTLCFTKRHKKKKCKNMKSGNLGKDILRPLPIQRPENMLFSVSRTLRSLWPDASSCWNHIRTLVASETSCKTWSSFWSYEVSKYGNSCSRLTKGNFKWSWNTNRT